MVERSGHRTTERGPLLRHLAVLCVKLAIPALTCLGLAILLTMASTAGPQALVGFLCYLATRKLKVIYGAALGFAAVWVVACQIMDGIRIGTTEFRSHELLNLDNLPALPINLLVSLLFGILGIKIGYAFRDACRRARNRVRDLGREH